MPQIINTNIASLTAQRNLNKSQSANQQALQRLSSGLRINSAKDDAAGLAISTRFNSQIRGLNVAIRNAGDGISLAQTAEGALGTMNDNLQRIRELAVQSANATNSDVDREALQAEVDQLLAEVTRTAEETDFNGRKLLDGSFNASFQIGANAGQTVNVSIAELTAEKLGAGQEAGVSALGTDSALSNGDLVINGEGIRASSATDDTGSTSGADRSAISKAAAINDSTSTTGVAADVNVNVAAGTSQTAAATDGSLTLNGVTINIATGGVDTAADRAAVIQAINAVSGQTQVTAVDSNSDDSGISLQAADGRNIELRYDKFDANGDAFASGVTASATGLTLGGVGDASGATAESAVITGSGSIAELGNTLDGSFNIAIDGEEAIAVTLTGTAADADGVVASLQSSINSAISANGLDVSVTVSSTNGIVSITSDSVGAGSSLVISAVTSSADAADSGLMDILGVVTGGAVFGDFTTVDFLTVYLADTGTDGGDNTQATYTGLNGLAGNDGAASTNVTAADAIFTIEVDGGIAVTVTVGAEVNAFATLGNGLIAELDAYTTKIESAINSQLTADGQTSSVTVGYDEGYRLTITSNAEGTDSAVRITTVTTGAQDVGIVTQTAGADAENGNVGTNGVENASETYEGSITLRSVNGGDITVAAGSGSLDSSGLQSGTFNAGQAFASSQSQSVSGAIATSGQVVGEKTSTGGFDDTQVTSLAGDTLAFSIEVDGGDVVSVSVNYSTGSSELDGSTEFLAGLEATINTALSTNGQTASVSVSLNADNQIVIASNTKGESSTIEISAVETANDVLERTVLGLYNNLDGAGSSGAVATSAVLTAVGDLSAGAGVGTGFSTTLLAEAGILASETLRISVDGGPTIDADIANVTVSDAAAALAFVQTEINDALAAAGQTATVTLATNVDGFVTITSDAVGAGSSVEILSNNTAGASFSRQAGLNDYHKSTVAVDGVATPDGLDSGDLVLNGVAVESALAADDAASNNTALSSSKQASGIATAAAINRVSDATGVQATVNTTSLSGGTQVATSPSDTPQQGSIVINGVETSTITTNGANGGADDRAASISAINAITGQTGVTAVDDGEGITLEAADGRNISVVINNAEKAAADSGGSLAALTGAAIGLNVAEADISGGATFAATAETTFSTVTLDGPGTIDIQAGANGAAALEALGFRVGEYGSTEAGTRLSDLDISTVAGAEAAIKALDNAIGSVASQRATLGAIQNRLDSTVNNLSVTSNNLSAANSRIQDADFAAETAELSRTQVLQQAGISILAQANAGPQQVLSLLG